jgi:hypothetical protein
VRLDAKTAYRGKDGRGLTLSNSNSYVVAVNSGQQAVPSARQGRDSIDNFRERFEALEQQTEQLKHQTQALEAHTRTVERRLRWWRGRACGIVIPALFSLALPSGKAADTPAQTSLRQTLLVNSRWLIANARGESFPGECPRSLWP